MYTLGVAPVVPCGAIQLTIAGAWNIKVIPIQVAIAKGQDSLPKNKPIPKTHIAIIAMALPTLPVSIHTILHIAPEMAVSSVEVVLAKTKSGTKAIANIMITGSII